MYLEKIGLELSQLKGTEPQFTSAKEPSSQEFCCYLKDRYSVRNGNWINWRLRWWHRIIILTKSFLSHLYHGWVFSQNRIEAVLGVDKSLLHYVQIREILLSKFVITPFKWAKKNNHPTKPLFCISMVFWLHHWCNPEQTHFLREHLL